jgi:LPXTG-site transpeptidase (sortase) family protein
MNLSKYYKVLKYLNIISSIIIVILGLFILIRPFIPDIILFLSANEFKGYPYRSEKSIEVIRNKAEELTSIPSENRLVIPKIYVNSQITEGVDDFALNLGMWRRPYSSTPLLGGNTVITGHRFLNTSGPDTLYFLNKIEVGDIVLVYWQGKEYVYKVYEITEVDPNSIEIEYNTEKPIITLYTCTPLWTSEKRLVVKAALQ